MGALTPEQIRQAVRRKYGRAAQTESGCGCAPSCCETAPSGLNASRKLGYSAEDLRQVPSGANLGLGCGNPQAIAALQPGETVIDLGSGGGFDCFLAARQVGPSGHVIGVDMTPEMIAKARANAQAGDYPQVEFRLGEIEHLPVADACADVIISNCVINLSADKGRVYSEAFRVLKPGGRLAISDTVAMADLPADAREDLELHAACIAGALPVDQVEALLRDSGFEQVQVTPEEDGRDTVEAWAPGSRAAVSVLPASIEATKPVRAGH